MAPSALSATTNGYPLDYAGFATTNPGLVSIMNAFHRTADGIFHSLASELLSRPMANGHPTHVDVIWPLWNLLDMTPEGRGDAVIPRQDQTHRYSSTHPIGNTSS